MERKGKKWKEREEREREKYIKPSLELDRDLTQNPGVTVVVKAFVEKLFE
jgi:hypothetical protein